jgi:peptidoglycan/LPS O-acetylase OafA/YrhL
MRPVTGRPVPSRLAGIDGLRALAALWVVFFHIYAVSHVKLSYIPGLDLFLRSGSTGVSLFLVLSGFCLYLPFAGGCTNRFRTGAFFRRRWRRLMPAYYASLPVSLALTLAGGTRLGFPHLTWSQTAFHILTHATMTYTFFPSTFYSLNGVYWSLGLEWQLYLTLPLLIWGIMRFGLRKTATMAILCNVAYRVLLAMAIDHGLVARGSLLASAVLPNQLPGRWAEFVLGMVVADLYVTGRVGAWARWARYVVPVLIPLGVVAHEWPLGHIVFGCVFCGLVSMVLASPPPSARSSRGRHSWPSEPCRTAYTSSTSWSSTASCPWCARIAMRRRPRPSSSWSCFYRSSCWLPGCSSTPLSATRSARNLCPALGPRRRSCSPTSHSHGGDRCSTPASAR